MNARTEKMLSLLCEDYRAVNGRPFKNFYCPITFEDEPTELCLGHVINKSIDGAVRTKTVQRKDVDNFYGAVAEAELEAFLATKAKSPAERMKSRALQTTRPKLRIDGTEIDYHKLDGQRSPDHTHIRIEETDGTNLDLVVHKCIADVLAASTKQWDFLVESDCRVPAIATFIKAAHLTLFRVLGYRYVCSAAGEFIGRQILGRFFRENQRLPIKAAKKNAIAFFLPYGNILRPILGSAPFRGTVEDGKILLVSGRNKQVFAIGVIIRAGQELHCVLVPEFGVLDTIPTYLSFLENSDEKLSIREAKFDRVKMAWALSSGPLTQVHWPKSGDDALSS